MTRGREANTYLICPETAEQCTHVSHGCGDGLEVAMAYLHRSSRKGRLSESELADSVSKFGPPRTDADSSSVGNDPVSQANGVRERTRRAGHGK